MPASWVGHRHHTMQSRLVEFGQLSQDLRSIRRDAISANSSSTLNSCSDGGICCISRDPPFLVSTSVASHVALCRVRWAVSPSAPSMSGRIRFATCHLSAPSTGTLATNCGPAVRYSSVNLWNQADGSPSPLMKYATMFVPSHSTVAVTLWALISLGQIIAFTPLPSMPSTLKVMQDARSALISRKLVPDAKRESISERGEGLGMR